MTQPLKRGEPYRAKSQKVEKSKLLLVSLLNRFPPLKQLLYHVWLDIKILKYKYRSKKWMVDCAGGFDADKTYYVDPEKIKYSSLIEFDISEDKARIVGGDWDRLEKRFEDLDVYVAFKERFMEGKEWKDTFFYQRVLNEIMNGGVKWGCKNKSGWDERCERLDLLYYSIKKEGYRAQRDILLERNIYNILQKDDEITVNVGRHGDLLFNNGAHRLSIVKLLGVERIPIKITVRHPKWASFRREILSYAKEHDGNIYIFH